MSYCKYHPLAPATFACHDCAIQTCDQCSNEGNGQEVRCFLCDQPLVSLGGANQAEPFWRRFDKAFRYPLSTAPVTLIVVLALLSSVLTYLPFAFLLYLAVTGALIKYAFSCLQSSATGSMEAPDVTASYGDGLVLVIRLFLIFIAVGAAIGALYNFFGTGLASLVGGIVVAALPAVIIVFAMTDSILEAINPARVFRLINAIGLPYGLLLAIIMIMSGSVGVISQLLGNDFSFVSQVLNAMVSNYYTIVLFHLMGYMLFQYQAELGYVARADGEDAPLPRDDEKWALAKVQVLVKEGRYRAAAEVFDAALANMPDSEAINSQYFEFLLATHNPRDPASSERLKAFASRYLRFLDGSQRRHILGASYRRILQALPNYLPDTAALRLRLAQACHKSGDPRAALRLLNGLHRQFPDFEDLIPAYQLVAEIIDNLPGMADQAAKCRTLIKSLQRREAAAVSSVVSAD